MKKPLVLVITGPTAAGKSSLAMQIAERLDGEIIGADSMQIYLGADIATAKPTPADRSKVRHHLVDILSPAELCSVARWRQLADGTVRDVLSRNKLPVICGGTVQYISSFLHNISYSGDGADPVLREKLKRRAETEGGAALLAELSAADPKAAEMLHENDITRIVRALELAYSGVTKTEQNRLSVSEPPYELCAVSVEYFDRSSLYSRIDSRVESMIGAGMEDEARRLCGVMGATAYQAIGYKEFEPYFTGKRSLEATADAIKQASRNYAKRQLTWLRAEPMLNRICADSADCLDLCIKLLQYHGKMC